ncbi:MAG TPA: hypothetical protein VG322_00220 [Candidatus Acidoferrales bacterium]|jgi:hypothetical protein|nr:hypothetical protein [Candidatus Acidoferrales bacterium]
MVSMKFVNSLSELASPVLTAYLNTQPADASKQPLATESLVWLKKQAKEAAATVHEKEQKRFWRQVERVEEFLIGRKSQERAVVIFCRHRHVESGAVAGGGGKRAALGPAGGDSVAVAAG